MEGKTIKLVQRGEIGGEAIMLLYMTDDSIFMVEGYASYGLGMLAVNEIRQVPKEFKENEV